MSADDPIDALLELAVAEATWAGAERVELLHVFIAACKIDDQVCRDAFEGAGMDPVELRRRARGIAHEAGGAEGSQPEAVDEQVTWLLQHASDHASFELRRRLRQRQGSDFVHEMLAEAGVARPDRSPL